MFIVFEGLDGSGSSTQAAKICEYLKGEGHDVLAAKEPTGQVLGKLVRDVLQGKLSLSAKALQLLFCADRAEHLANIIEPALKDGKIVISDRYYFSTIAFGSIGLDRNWLETVNSTFLKPDIVFLFKLDSAECIKRIEKRGGQKELFEKEQILKQVWETYDYLNKKHDNCILIDASLSIEEIFEEIKKNLRNLK